MSTTVEDRFGNTVPVSGPGVTISAFVATLLDDADAAAFFTTLGISAFVQTLLNDTTAAVACSTLGLSSTLLNTRLAKTGIYSLANTDNGLTIALGGASFYQLTVGAASGFDANFQVRILNEDTGRGKKLAINGLTTFILWPGQSITLYNQNNVWKLDPAAQRWVLQANATFYVDVTNGADTNDGLAAGSGNAFATIAKAVAVVTGNVAGGAGIDCNNYSVIIQLAAGTYSENVLVTGGIVGNHVFQIIGDTTTPSNVVWQTAAVTPCLWATDYGCVQLSGVRLKSTTSNSTLLRANQSGILDFDHVDFNAGTGAVHCSAYDNGKINATGNYTITSTAFTYHMLARYMGVIDVAGVTVTVSNAATFTHFWIASRVGLVSATATVTFSGTGAGAGSTGTKYTANYGGHLELTSTTLPGASAGSADAATFGTATA